MAHGGDLGPLHLEQRDNRWRLTLSPMPDLSWEVPPDFHRTLGQKLAALVGQSGPLDIFLDLQEIPAISSRQLGLMLALKKALHGRCNKIRVTGVRSNVLRLLEITQTLQFFEVGENIRPDPPGK